jgi:hypothetical protein
MTESRVVLRRTVEINWPVTKKWLYSALCASAIGLLIWHLIVFCEQVALYDIDEYYRSAMILNNVAFMLATLYAYTCVMFPNNAFNGIVLGFSGCFLMLISCGGFIIFLFRGDLLNLTDAPAFVQWSIGIVYTIPSLLMLSALFYGLLYLLKGLVWCFRYVTSSCCCLRIKQEEIELT